MIILHQYPAIWDLPSLSPFCIKVETYLRMAAIPYQVRWQNNPKRGPKGKFPVLEDNGKLIPDSSFIIDYLNVNYAPSMSFSDPSALAMQRLIEDHLYFIILYSRWIDKDGIKTINSEFAPFFPKPLAFLALKWIRKQLTKQGYVQGIARHSKEEVYSLGVIDINTIAAWLGKKLFCLGEQYCAIDAIVYAFLRTIQQSPLQNPLKSALENHSHLIQYCERIHEKYFN